MAIDRKTVEHVARLARLELAPQEIETYGRQLGAILDYIAVLQKLDVSRLEPLVHAAESSNVFRDDAPRPGLARDEALKNAPERSHDFFIVPKVVE
jgi:aspartyl-tRNA(Asn)/glutamyl-tRNA(Gln) amidotransferase subunit C